ncbi:MAG: hypothetical protein COZ33_04025 [Nitrospirae bacterium CG_4_10_14_3_um_filter_70_108]|nr:MAG: hypothetical protein COZ33_04025 [Nitrospirae bacterium CG_4_10_14_3_um_filter_70_108]
MKIIFWTSLVIWAYAYAGYPLLLLLMRLLAGRRDVVRGDVTPRVTILVPVHNGATIIADKIRRLLALDYPAEQVEIVVVSDGSDDGTGEFVRREAEADPRVRLVEVAEQRGKENAINEGVAVASGEVVVVSDSGVHPFPGALRRLVQVFADPTVGAATGVDVPEATGGSSVTGVAGFYTRYEIGVRKLEASAGTMVVVNGCFFAVRRELVPRLVPHVTADLFVPFNVIRSGYRVALVPEAAATVRTSRSVKAEFRRRVRTFNRGITTFFTALDLLDPFRYGWVGVQVTSHKLARWLVPLSLVGLLVSTAALAPSSPGFAGLFLVQLLTYGLALLGLTGVVRGGLEKLASIPSFYLLSNLSIAMAWLQVIRGKKAGTWQPTVR